MSGLGQILAFGAGSLCLGVGLTLAVFIRIGARHSDSTGEGCLGVTIVLPILALSAYLFLVAVQA